MVSVVFKQPSLVMRVNLSFFVVFRHALSMCTIIHPKQEQVETNGDGVEHPCMRKCPMRDTFCPSLDIFWGSPPKKVSVGLRSVPICFGVVRGLKQRSL